ncbi:hypothetical protein ABZX95_51330 [Streptomyces sp. NPDC004232]|uniref:hypothetical protein n=1 Tax=Streptomyces sp. NPDC004232 TaxID=3154454 RepID=UPI001D31B3D7|nr:hypothetical protein [Streptomyces sp. tea 10]
MGMARRAARATGLAVAIALGACSCSGSNAPAQTPKDVAVAFYKADATGDGKGKCALMTPAYQKVEVGVDSVDHPHPGSGTLADKCAKGAGRHPHGDASTVVAADGDTVNVPANCAHPAGIGVWVWKKQRANDPSPTLEAVRVVKQSDGSWLVEHEADNPDPDKPLTTARLVNELSALSDGEC